MIILGSSKAQKDYISSLVTQYSIPAYGITTIEGVVKIEDVHRIVRASRVHIGKGEKRLTVFSGSLTIPAQNALLKYLEELSESDYVLFLVDSADTLLETIRSRCIIRTVDSKRSDKEKKYSDLLQELIAQADFNKSILQIASEISSAQDYTQFVIELRDVIVEKVIQNDKGILPNHVRLLQYISLQNQYVQENNVNPRFTVESFK